MHINRSVALMYLCRRYESEQQERAEQQLLLEHDLRKAIDRIHELETIQNTLTKERDAQDDSINTLKQTYSTEKKNLETRNVKII
jgi:DNA-binding protein H-NS